MGKRLAPLAILVRIEFHVRDPVLELGKAGRRADSHFVEGIAASTDIETRNAHPHRQRLLQRTLRLSLYPLYVNRLVLRIALWM
jgi:hypothetical protein